MFDMLARGTLTSTRPVACSPPLTRLVPPRRDGSVLGEQTHTIRFEAPDEGRAKLTWGQLNMWFPLREFGDESARYNLVQPAIPAQPMAVQEVLLAISGLVERHQALRTTIRADEADDPEQIVLARGTYGVVVHEVAPDELAETMDAIIGGARSRPFDLENELPARFHCVAADGLVHGVVVIVSHLVVDGVGIRVLVRSLGHLLAGAPQADQGGRWEPLDQAAYEQSAGGRKRHERALAHWRSGLEEVMSGLRPSPKGDWAAGSSAGGFHRTRMQSRAVVVAAQRLADETSTSASAVLLAATSLLLRGVTGQDAAILKTITANRFTNKQGAYAGCCAQDGLFVLDDLDGRSLRELLHRAMERSTKAAFNAQYDPRVVGRAVREIAAAHDAAQYLTMYFNDSRGTLQWPDSTDDVESLKSATTIEYLGAHAQDDMTFHLHVWQDESACGIDLNAADALLSSDDCAAFLSSLEELVCRASLGEIEPGAFHSAKA